jgi:hypothetical protein
MEAIRSAVEKVVRHYGQDPDAGASTIRLPLPFATVRCASA